MNAQLCHVAVHFLPSLHKSGRNVSRVLRTYISSTKICDQISYYAIFCVPNRPVTEIMSHEYTTASYRAEQRHSVLSASTGRTTQHSLQNQSTANISRQINSMAKKFVFPEHTTPYNAAYYTIRALECVQWQAELCLTSATVSKYVCHKSSGGEGISN